MNEVDITNQLRDIYCGIKTAEDGFYTPYDLAEKTSKQVIEKAGDSASVCGPGGPSSSHFIILLDRVGDTLWLSYFGKLATIFHSEEMDVNLLDRVHQVLIKNGWTLIPEAIVHRPIDDSEPDKTWFTEMFDYE